MELSIEDINNEMSKNPNSPIVYLLNKLEGKTLIPIYSSEMMKEYLEVLPRDKFQFNKEQINYIVNLILDNGIIIKPSHIIDEEFKDVDDIPFYETVVKANEIPKKDFIITAREMMEIMQKN